jgi:hypothetical protein
MLKNEAKWFGDRVRELGDAQTIPMLNIGSHTEEFRRVQQPWIDRCIFAPLRERGQAVTHTDMRAAPGVDLVGDLTDAAFRQRLAAMRFRSAFCSNLLEHVADRTMIARLVTEVVMPGGYLFVSVPNRFPYHPDPIDTMFRPGIEELAALFPGTRVHQAAILPCGTLWGYATGRLVSKLRGRPAGMTQATPAASASAPGATSPASEAGNGKSSVVVKACRLLPWLFRRFKVTCLVLRKEGT